MTTLKLYLNRFVVFPNLLKIFDNLIKKFFLKKTLNHYEKLNKPYWIIINDNLLKFHNKDIRKQIKKELLN